MSPSARGDLAPPSKAGLRAEVSARIEALSAGYRSSSDARIATFLGELCGRLAPAYVCGYVALADEARVDAFLAAVVEGGIPALLPRVVRGELRFGRWTPGCRLRPDEKGVPSPAAGGLERLPGGTGLIVVPARALDATGGRLGRGGGFYDRLLAGAGPTIHSAAAGYDCQVVPAVPRLSHDQRVGYLVTESGWRPAASSDTQGQRTR